MNEPLLFATLSALAVLFMFLGLGRLLSRRDAVDNRLKQYGAATQNAGLSPQRRRNLTLFKVINRLVNGFGAGPSLARLLAQADLPMTVAEFTVVLLLAALLGLALGWLRDNLIVGLLAATLFGSLPLFYLKFKQMKRQRSFGNQLPDILTLLVSGLRAGYGLNQAINVLVEQLPAPASTEFARIQQAVNLGMPLQRALADRAKLLGNDDFDLIVTAITVQYEVGGNLAQVLDTIGDTIRERIRILREVSVLTAQQRLTGYILVAAPLILAVALSILQPGFFDPFFEPGPVQYLPFIATSMLLVGFLLIRRIVDIRA